MNTLTTSHIDFIGDIHGHAEELIELLEKLGYSKKQGYYQHEQRKVFFCGDFIDRGPQIKEVLQIVKAMIDNEAAFTVIGNHEYNAICYHTLIDGNYLRKHSSHNNTQHAATIAALNKDELEYYINWFKTLNIYCENENFKVVHAQWEPEYINQLKFSGINNFSDQDFLIKSATKGSSEYKMIDCLLKGKEIRIPGISFFDKDGKERDAYRIKWWKKGMLLCKDTLFEFPKDNEQPMPFELLGIDNQSPVFFGHYWLKDEQPVLQNTNACCIDFSVAKEGLLCTYQWDGEKILSSDKFVWVLSKDIKHSNEKTTINTE